MSRDRPVRPGSIHGGGSDGANELVLEVAVADEEPSSLEFRACLKLPVPGPRQRLADVPLLGSVAQAREAQTVAVRAETGEEGRQGLSAADRHHDDAFPRQVSCLEACQSLHRDLIADSLDQDDGSRVPGALQCRCGRSKRRVGTARVAGHGKIRAPTPRALGAVSPSRRCQGLRLHDRGQERAAVALARGGARKRSIRCQTRSRIAGRSMNISWRAPSQIDELALRHLRHLAADDAGRDHALVAAEEDEHRQVRQRRDVEPRHLLERGVGPLHAGAAERRARDGR